MIPFRSVGVTSTLTYSDYNKSELSKSVNSVHTSRPNIVGSFHLGTGIYILNDRVALGRVEIKWLVHHAPKICHTVSSFDREYLGEFVAHIKERSHIYLFQIEEFLTVNRIERT